MPPEKPIQNIKDNFFNVLYGLNFFNVLYGKVMPPEKHIQNIKENLFNVLYGKVIFFIKNLYFFQFFWDFFWGAQNKKNIYKWISIYLA